jgi:signal transduction histidine kinase
MSEEYPSMNRLLIVDDDLALTRTLSAILIKAGYRVESVTTGGEAIRAIEKDLNAFNAVLVDLQLPDMNGLDILKRIRTLSAEIGALMLTGHAEMDTAVAALNAGAFAYIQKPYNIDEVKAILTRLMEKQKLLRDNQHLLQQMIRLNSELDEKVHQRTLELQKANLSLANTVEELQRAAAAKSDFLSMVSHELRTPLTVIIGFAQTLVQEIEKMDKASIKRYMQIVDIDAHRLLRLIEGILDLSTIAKKGMTLNATRFNVRVMVEGVSEGFRLSNRERDVQVFCDESIDEIDTDRDRLQQVIVNLLGNAAKYSPVGGLIRIELNRKDDDLRGSVTDSGPGISDEQKDKIFEPFYRTQDAINFKAPGTGLGLTISKAIMAAMGGRIWVENVLPHGSRFCFHIPSAFGSPQKNQNAA